MRKFYIPLAHGFRNAAWLRSRYSPSDRVRLPGRAAVPAAEGVEGVALLAEEQWAPEHFWCPEGSAHGYPVAVIRTQMTVAEVRCVLVESELDAVVGVTSRRMDCVEGLYRRPWLLLVAGGAEGMDVDVDVLGAAHGLTYGCPGVDDRVIKSYTQFMSGAWARTEVAWGMIGAWAWSDLEAKLAAIAVPVVYSAELDAIASRAFSACWDTRGSRIVRGQRSGSWEAAIAWMDRLCPREDVFKRRHYFDLVSLLRALDRVYGHFSLGAARVGQRARFREAVRMLVFEMACAGVAYERLYLTVFWVFTSRQWPGLVWVLRRIRTHVMSDADFVAVHKEITAVVTASWMVPLTANQDVLASHFLNAENLIGWSDRDSVKGAVCTEVLAFATSEFAYTYGEDMREKAVPSPDGAAEYLARYKVGIRDILQPMYSAYGGRSLDRSTFLSERMAWGAGGAAGARVRELFGPKSAPQGSTKAYALSRMRKSELTADWGTMHIEVGGKGNERGAERTLMATDLRDQVAEAYLLHPFKNKYGLVGIDIGESPVESMTRHLAVVAATDRGVARLGDGLVLVAWDYSQFDHYVMQAERLLVCDVMRELIVEYVPEGARAEMLEELDVVEAGQREAVYRSRAYADKDFGARVDAILGDSGKGRRLAADRVLLSGYNGQLSGRRSTLETNTFYSRGRLAVRNSALPGGRLAYYTLNRADDVLELYEQWLYGKEAVEEMLREGQRANLKKQVVQCRTGVYFRVLHAAGTMRGFPARAVYSAATAGPSQRVEGGVDPVERLSSLSGALCRLARRGGSYAVSQALYSDAVQYYRKVRLEKAYRGGVYRSYVIPEDVLEASPEMGGFGVLPPGRYTHDLRVKVSKVPTGTGKLWGERAARAEARHHFPGLDDLQGRVESMVRRDFGRDVPPEALRLWKRRWKGNRAGQDGRQDLLRARHNARMWGYMRRAHVDRSDPGLVVAWRRHELLNVMGSFELAYRLSLTHPGDKGVHMVLKRCRGPRAEGMFAKLWYGLAQDAVASGEMTVHEAARGTQLGREFLQEYGFLTPDVMEAYLRGKMGPAGAWSALVPAGWMPWLHESVNYIVVETLRGVRTHSMHQILAMRQEVTRELVECFGRAFPGLMLF